jgi:hypothetical protein
MHEDDERIERNLRIELEIEHEDLKILHELEELERPRLSTIKIAFFTHVPPTKGALHMSAVQGPVTLTTLGQVAIATVLGFDQTGALMPAGFVMPVAAFSSDDTAGAIVTSKDNGDGTDTVTAVANGVANITGEVVTAEGKTLTDTESVTVAIVVVPPPPPPTPVLSSIKVAFSTNVPLVASGAPLPAPGPTSTAAPAAGATVRFAGPQPPQHTGAAE